MKNTKKHSMKCPYCGAPAICRPASIVYGSETIDRKSYLYLCSRWPACDAYVSAHKKDHRPMGTMANGDLRHKRILAHRALQKLQKERHMDKWAVYVWLQAKFNLDKRQAHIAMFSEQMCDQVISLCRSPAESGRNLAA